MTSLSTSPTCTQRGQIQQVRSTTKLATSVFGHATSTISVNPSDRSPNGSLRVISHYPDDNDRDITTQYASYTASDPDHSSPPPPDLPTWDEIPVNNLPEKDNPSYDYELRPGPRVEGKQVFPTWLDQDGTETYDPNSAMDPYIRPPLEVLERRRRRRQDHLEDDSNRVKRQKTSTWQHGRNEGKRLPVKFTFHTDQARSALASYGSTLDVWPPSAWVPPNEDIDWKSWWDPDLCTTDAETNDFPSKRCERRTRLVNDADEGSQSIDLTDLVGHPVARGCKGCLELGHRCALLDEGSSYPCEICVQDDVDCELIREPIVKRSCLNCGRKRIRCSYRLTTGDHDRPCANCTSQGLKCIAGPASGRTRLGPALDSATHNRAGELTKKFVSCTQCRQGKRWCSRIKDKSSVTCNECLKNGETCTFESIKRTKARVKCVKKLRAQPKASIKPGKDQQFRGKMTQFVQTRLCHPIELNYVGDKSCHWCQDVGYGIFGLGIPLKVEVVDFHDGNGYIELCGGYFEAGMETSRMCDNCAFARLAIAACLKHEVQDISLIEGMDINDMDLDCIYDYLRPGMAATAPFSWCSICPNPALYACCKQADMLVSEPDEVEGTEQKHGCGLKLCGDCAACLVHDSEGALEALVEKIREEDPSGMSLRADADMILPGGELVGRIAGDLH